MCNVLISRDCVLSSADRLRSARVLDAQSDPPADDRGRAQVCVDGELPAQLREAPSGGRQLLLPELGAEPAAV